MTADLPGRPTVSPFDAGRIPCPQGGEDRWSARWLMEQLGYESWQKFEGAIERAKTTAHNEGFNSRILFRLEAKKPGGEVITGSGKNSGGRPYTDYLLTRYAAYLVAMNADSRKQQVADAQHYFAVKTRQAEVAAPPLTDDEIIHRALTLTTQRVAELTERVAELTPSAAAWDELADASGDYQVGDAAKVLSRDPYIDTGRDRLFKFMQSIDWVYRSYGRWRAYQSQVNLGRLVEKVGSPYRGPDGEMRVGDPTVRITPKGLAELHKRLGGSGQFALVAVS